MKNILTIAQKELRSYFNNPTAYIVVLAFLLLWEFLFFRNVFLVGEASLRGLFEFLPWIFMIIIPALTMGSLAEEKSEGTLEFLLTHPINQWELVVGKFIGILVFLAISLLFIFPLAWSLNHFGNLDWGEVVGQYFAGLLMASVLVSLGVVLSGFFASQISAFLVSCIASFFLVISGSEIISARMPLFAAPFLEQLSLSNHFDSMSRGVIDARDVWYFLSLTAVFLGFAFLKLIKDKYGNRKKVYRNFQSAAILLVGIVILSNIVGSRIPGRIDLTEGKIYSLSPATKQIAGSLPDIVNISLYASDKLPAQLQPTLRDTKDILEDYKTAAKGKIRVNYKNPSTDSAAGNEAISLGVQPVRFNMVSQEEFQVKEGYLGLVVSYGGNHETIPYVQNINDLEYQMSSFLRKLTNDNKPKIGFLNGHGEKTLMSDYGLIGQELKKQFDVQTITAKGEDTKAGNNPNPQGQAEQPVAAVKKFTIPDDVKALVIAGPTEDFSDDEKKTLTDYVNKGGSLLFLLNGVTISAETMSATPNEKAPIEFLKKLTGVEVKKDMAYDLKSNETVGFGNGPMSFMLPYPFWLDAIKANGNSPITSKIDSLVLPWASTLSIDGAQMETAGFKKIDLFSTTEYAGTQTAGFNLAPDQKFSQQGLGKKLMAVSLIGQDVQNRMVIVGSADFLSDQFVQNSAANFSFALESISWLSQESALSKIGVKNIADRKLKFNQDSDASMIKFGNMSLAFFATAGFGSWRLIKRKKMKEKRYRY